MLLLRNRMTLLCGTCHTNGTEARDENAAEKHMLRGLVPVRFSAAGDQVVFAIGTAYKNDAIPI
jgi:hypothetical protein